MREQSEQNKIAWEHRAYEFWEMREGSPEKKALEIKENPLVKLKYHKKYFENVQGLKIANPCGSNGRKAVPLALLGAEVTVFDISEENKRFALELAEHAGVKINYEVIDFLDLDTEKYDSTFDMLYLEGGILHYFSDLNSFIKILYSILKKGGKLVLSDFHPFRKTDLSQLPQTVGNYFDNNLHRGNVAYKQFFPKEEQGEFPDCILRYYTLSEIINTVILSGFTIKEFEEHPNWNNENLPGEFTIFAVK
jgi:2-polyprenyl-3-methyl-5-hydroxy-6-metoxy-1,4-benzoquinol methylase